jgi:hypothetical protein
MIVSPIRYDEQGPFGVLCTPHFAQTEVDGVEEGGSSFRGGQHHAVLEIFHAVGKFAGQFRTFVKADEEEFVCRVGGFEELNGGFPRLAYFIAHASTDIENYANRDWHIFRGEGFDFLLDVVLKHPEVILLKSGDKAVVRVSDGYIDEGKADFTVNLATWFYCEARRVVLYVIGFLG